MINYTLALIVPFSFQRQLASQLCFGLKSGIWVEPDSLHIQMRLMGALSASEVYEVKVAMRDVYFNLVSCQLNEMKYIPITRKHGSLLIEAKINESLLQIKKEVDKPLKKIKLPSNPLAPHIHIGNCDANEVGDYLFNHSFFTSTTIEVTGLSLFSIHASNKKIFLEEVEHYPASDLASGAD